LEYTSIPTRFGRFILAGYSIIISIPLVIYAYNGLSMRYSGDDFCYAGIFRTHGFFGTQVYSYLHVSGYNGNRYSLNLFSALADLFPPVASGLLPVLAILLLIAGLTWVFISAATLFISLPKARPDRLVLFLTAEILAFFLLNTAPNLGQSLYWRTGMLTYLAPILAGVLLAGLILSLARSDRPLWAVSIACLFLSFLAGGFSETGAAVQGAFWGLAFLGAVSLHRRGNPRARRLAWLLGASVAGVLLAISVLYISPINQARMAQMPPRPGLFDTISIALQSTVIFTYISLKYQMLPNILLVIFFVLLSLFVPKASATAQTFSFRRWFLSGITAGIAAIILILCGMLPFAYVQHGYPDQRSLIIPRFIMVLGEAFAGWLAGEAISRLFLVIRKSQSIVPPRPRRAAIGPALFAVVLLVSASLYPLSAANDQLSQTWHYQKWARFWDARDLAIQQARLEHRSNVKVVKIDHIILDVADLSPDPRNWYNGCAAMYYGVTAISATLPGWDAGDQ
jgi:hypothetical protein